MKVMRELGIAAHDGTVLGPEPRPVEELRAEKADPNRIRRAFYTNQLGRPVSDDELKNYP